MHLRVGGPIDMGSVTRNGVNHVRLAVGVAAVHLHRCGVNHAGTWVYTLTTSVRSRKANCPRRRSMPPLPALPALDARAARRIARVAGRCRTCPRHEANRPRRKANRPSRGPLPPLPARQGDPQRRESRAPRRLRCRRPPPSLRGQPCWYLGIHPYHLRT